MDRWGLLEFDWNPPIGSSFSRGRPRLATPPMRGAPSPESSGLETTYPRPTDRLVRRVRWKSPRRPGLVVHEI